ncbi:unnamed protein product [Alopecurus aequalis]
MTMSSLAISSNLDDCKSLQQLWYACAGSSITIPQVGEPVFYFPQGHLEQTGGISMHLPGVPSRILCRVLNVELKSENDFVYACLVLLPELNHGFKVIDSKGLPSSTPRFSEPYFSKKLRVAHTKAHAWFSIPRKHAEKFLPPLDMTKMAPMQELVAKDLSGMKWRFQHRLVGPRRHLLQTAEYASSKNLVAGDAIAILRGEDGQLHVGVRRCMRNLDNMPSSEITNDEGHKRGLGILPSISHAITTRSKFTVVYRPRTGTGQFVVPYDQYVDSGKIWSVGERFRTIFREATTEHRDFHILDSNWIFQCHSRVDEGDSCIGESMRLQKWNLALQFITRVLVEMRQQLNEADFGAFDELKGDYFAKIVEQLVLKLLDVASTSAALSKLLEEIPQGLVACVQSVFPRIIHALGTYNTLSDVVPTLLELVSPESRESISRMFEAIREKVEGVVNIMLATLTDAMSASSLPETEDTGIGPVTKAVAEGTRSLLQHRDSLNLILAHSCCRVHEGVPSIESLHSLISGLIVHLERVLKRSCKGLLPKESQYIFLLNNMQFILNQFKSSVMEEPIGHHDWVIEHHKTWSITWKNTWRPPGHLYALIWQLRMESVFVSGNIHVCSDSPQPSDLFMLNRGTGRCPILIFVKR